MKLIYAGKFSGNTDDLPQRTVEGSVQFKEPGSMKRLAIILNAVSIVVLLLLLPVIFLRADMLGVSTALQASLGVLASAVCLLPHELLHALCFKGEVKMYTNLKQGMLFVAGTEDMSRARFIFMSMLPNLVFGFIPFIAFLIFPLPFFGFFGAIGIGSGVGDYMNVINCLVQVPSGASVFMSGIHSYWHMPKEDKNVD